MDVLFPVKIFDFQFELHLHILRFRESKRVFYRNSSIHMCMCMNISVHNISKMTKEIIIKLNTQCHTSAQIFFLGFDEEEPKKGLEVSI